MVHVNITHLFAAIPTKRSAQQSTSGSRTAPHLKSVIAADQQLAMCPALRDQMQPSILMALGSITICKVLWSKIMQNKPLPSFLFQNSLAFVNSFRPTPCKILICHSVTVPSTATTGVYPRGVQPPQQLIWFLLLHPFKTGKLNPRYVTLGWKQGSPRYLSIAAFASQCSLVQRHHS